MIRKLFLSSALVAAACYAGAQTNGGFEQWASSTGQPIEPTGWVTANLFASPLLTFPSPNPNDTSAFRIGAPNQAIGTYSLKIETIELQYNPDTTNIPDTLGVAFLGTVQTSPSLVLIDRIPFTSRPANFHHYYKYVPSGIDTGWCYIELSRWNGSSRDIVASAGIPYQGTTSAWTSQIVPLLYLLPNTFPDSLSIAFTSSSVDPQIGSSLWLDDLYFMGWSSVEDIYSGGNYLTAYPNPATDMITIGSDLPEATTLHVYDCIGRTVGTYAFNNKKYMLNTSGWRAGNYYYSVMDKSGKVLGGNTFTIAR